MGDMANFALDHMMDDDEMQNTLAYVPWEHLTDFEREFMYDYDGAQYLGVYDTLHPRGPHGSGACPRCGKPTELKSGRYGSFYGCKAFPSCNGSRSA